MKLETLINQLSDLGFALRNFSMEALPAEEAVKAHQLFRNFQSEIECLFRYADPVESIKGGSSVSDPGKSNQGMLGNAIQTPIGNIIGCSSLLKESELSLEQLEYVNAILASSNILMDLSRDIAGSAYHLQQHAHLEQGHQQGLSERMTPSTKITGRKQKFDLHPVWDDCLGEITLLEELILLFKRNCLEFIGEVKMHLQLENFEGIGFASHKIKNGLKMLHVTELLTIAEQMDHLSSTDKDLKYMKFLYHCFIDEYPLTEQAIDLEIVRMKKKQENDG